MVFTATLVLTITFSMSALAQDCTPDDIVLGSQEEVDNFQADHGPCDRVVRSLTIEGSDILNLGGLAALNSIGHSLHIQHNPELLNINGLSGMTSVGNSILVWDNFELVNVDGLSGISNVPGDLFVRDNSSLMDLDGLSGIGRVFGSLGIESNGQLRNVDGLSSLFSVGDILRIQTENLSDIDGLSNLNNVGGKLIIVQTTLTEVDGLGHLLSIGGDLWILGNHNLANLDGLSPLSSAGSVLVENNSSLADCQGLVRLVDQIDHRAPGPGSAGIPDVRGDVTLQNNLDGCNSVLEILGGVAFFEINAGMNDAWLDPETAGQGFLIIIFQEIKQVFLTWFTYDTERPPGDVTAILGEPGHRWLTAQGPYEGTIAVLDIFMTSGGVFDSPEPKPVPVPDGQIILEFSGCNAGTVSYDIPSVNRQGVIPIQRIVLDNVAVCYLLGNPVPEAAVQAD